MRAVAIRLKKKYNLNDNVRISLYECEDEWANAHVREKDFLGKKTIFIPNTRYDDLEKTI